MNYNKDTVIAEVAGKDSIAAIIKYAQENKGSYILPTIVKVPSEERRHEELVDYYECLQSYIFSLGSYMYMPIFIDSAEEWWELNRPVDDLISQYGFYSPCIACHGLVHAIRIPVAKQYSGKIITGERLSHNGKIKINQNELVLDMYDRVFEWHDIEIIRPLENEYDISNIDKLVEEFYTKHSIQKINYVKCHMSGSSNVSTEEDLDEYAILKYCTDYLLPKLDEIILKSIMKNDIMGL